METRISTLNEVENTGVGPSMPIRPKASAKPVSESAISEHDQTVRALSTARRHKVKPVPDADGHTQQGA